MTSSHLKWVKIGQAKSLKIKFTPTNDPQKITVQCLNVLLKWVNGLASERMKWVHAEIKQSKESVYGSNLDVTTKPLPLCYPDNPPNYSRTLQMFVRLESLQ